MPKKTFVYGLIYILANSILWGISPLIIKKTFIIIPPLVFLFYRFIWVSVFKGIELLHKKRHVRNFISVFKNKLLLASAFLLNFVTLTFYFLGLNLVTPLQAGVLAGSTPLFIIIPMIIFKKEQFTLKEIVGIIIMIVGYLFILAPQGVSGEIINWWGVVLITIGNLAYSVAVIINKRYLTSKNLVGYEFISSILALMGFLLIVLLQFSQFMNVTTIISGLINPGVLYMAFFGTLLALTFFNKSLLYLEASEAISFTYTQPFFLALLELLIGFKKADIFFVTGIFILFFGIIFNILGIIKEHNVLSKHKGYNQST